MSVEPSDAATAPTEVARPARAPSAETPARGSAFGSLFFFCVGALVMKLSGALPELFSSGFDLLVYAGIALSVAIAYRRFVRNVMEQRRLDRAERERRTTAAETTVARPSRRRGRANRS